MVKINLGHKQIGFIIIVISIVFALIVLDFTRKIEDLNSVLHKTCDLPDAVCPFVGTPHQSIVGFSVAGVLFAFGILLILLSRKSEYTKMEKMEEIEKIIKTLDNSEQKIYETIKNSGAIFQSELVEKSGFTKVKVTRILDKLEAKGIVERKRRGMTNIVMIRQ